MGPSLGEMSGAALMGAASRLGIAQTLVARGAKILADRRRRTATRVRPFSLKITRALAHASRKTQMITGVCLPAAITPIRANVAVAQNSKGAILEAREAIIIAEMGRIPATVTPRARRAT